MMPRLVANLQQLTPLRGERRPELYLVALQQRAGTPNDMVEGQLIPVGLGDQIGGWFSLQVSPVFQMQREQPWHFIGGLPIYVGEPAPRASVYFAILESDRRSRHAGVVLGEIFNERGDRSARALITSAARALRGPPASVLRPAFSLLIRAIEGTLRANHDDLRYTSIFTMKQANGFLMGQSILFNNGRIQGVINVEPESLPA